VTAVLLFAKAPRAGYVKTRLAADIGEARAVELYRRIGNRVASDIGSRFPLTVWYHPPGAEPELRDWLGDFEFMLQRGSDLGTRLEAAFGEHFARGDGPVVAVGADVPEVRADTVTEACRVLESADAVFGPALDGGYYLVGLTQRHDEVFRGIPWGGADVMQRTLEICQGACLKVGMLPVLRDIDTAADLAAFGDVLP
jgi:rSAM/selenodomain-associated transferase 1